jgi:LysR family nitrogen assimilation transcriptional regulator
MDLRQLTTFMQVAELGSLSKAADRLHIVQPALSRQIRLLEAELKTSLFTRHGRGMVLTPAGELLLARAGNILRQVEEARADLAEEAGTLRGQVILGVPPTVGDVLATRLVERFLPLYPSVRLRVVTGFTGHLLEWLLGGEIDIAVAYGTEKRANIGFAPLLAETLQLITAGTAPAEAGPVRFAELARRRLILPAPQHGLRLLLEREAQRQGLALSVPVEADSLPILRGLVQRGLGATILPMPAVHDELARGLLRATPVTDPPLSRKLVIARPLGRKASSAVQRFEALLRQEVTAMVRQRVWEGELLTGADAG